MAANQRCARRCKGRTQIAYLYHATRAELLRAAGREGEARAAAGRAFALTANPSERALLTLVHGPDLDGAGGPVPG